MPFMQDKAIELVKKHIQVSLLTQQVCSAVKCSFPRLNREVSGSGPAQLQTIKSMAVRYALATVGRLKLRQ